MILQQKSALRRTVSKELRNPVVLSSRETDLHSPVEGLLRDIALVLHATPRVRREMEAEQTICSAAS